MPLDNWLAFTAAAAVVLMIPGPTILLVVSYALGVGRRAGLAVVAGVALGDFTAMTLSLAGLGALLAASADLFTLLKWVGAAYLVYLGIKLWRAPVAPLPAEETTDAAGPSRRAMLLHAFAVTALNPKSIVFFVAFLPQFLDTGSPLLPQFAIMEATFLVLATANAAGYGLAAVRARRLLRTPTALRMVNRTGGSLLIAAGLAAAALRRTS